MNEWRRVWKVSAPLLLSTLVACGGGGGKDRSFKLPAGEEFDTLRSALVLVATETQNECDRTGDCVAPPAGPCHIGKGNTRGLSVYRLGQSGLLYSASAGGPIAPGPEQVVATDDNPRRVVAHPLDTTLLYVATKDRIQVFRLAPENGTRCIDETLSQQEVHEGSDSLDPVDLEIDPTVGNGILYVAGRGSDRIDAYSIAEDGTLPDIPTSCAVGRTDSEYQAVAGLTSDFVAAGGWNRIEIFPRAHGQFINATPTSTPTPTPSAAPMDVPTEGSDATATPTPAGTPTPSAAPTCVGARILTESVSSIGAAIVTDLLFAPSAAAPIGQLFVAEEVSRRLFTFPIDTGGQIDDDDSSRTKADEFYQTMLRRDRSDSSVLYASAFQEGRVVAFRLEDGLLPNGSFSRTAQDVNSLPVGLVIAGDSGNVLYVAQGGLGRIDGFSIEDDGSLSSYPATTSAPVVNARGQTISSFPNDVLIVPLP